MTGLFLSIRDYYFLDYLCETINVIVDLISFLSFLFKKKTFKSPKGKTSFNSELHNF